MVETASRPLTALAHDLTASVHLQLQEVRFERANLEAAVVRDIANARSIGVDICKCRNTRGMRALVLTPERLNGAPELMRALCVLEAEEKMSAFVMDECHLVLTWGRVSSSPAGR